MDVLLAIILGFYAAQVDALQCNSSTAYRWARNTNGQDPCQLVSPLWSLCAPNADPLQPLSYASTGANHYPGPNTSTQSVCACSYVMYNLMAACGDCQIGSLAHGSWPTYRDWAESCEPTNTGGIYPASLPSSFIESIPTWARFSTKESGDTRWSYGLSHAVASGHVLVNSNVVASAACPPPPSRSPALPIGTAFAGLFVGLVIALLGFFLQRKRRAHVIPPPTRYHTAPDNTPLVPLVPRAAAYAQGTNFLRRMLEHDQENDPRRIEPFDITTAAGVGTFPPHPAVFPPRRAHAFPPTASASALSHIPSRGPSRQTSSASLNPVPFSAHPASLRHSQSQPKMHSRPHTSHSFFSTAESPGAGPSVLPRQDLPPSEPPSPSPPDHVWPEAPEDPPAYRRKS